MRRRGRSRSDPDPPTHAARANRLARASALVRELYVSALFRKSRAWAEAHCERWFVLSALHGLVDPDQVIEPYDFTLGRDELTWGLRVVTQLEALGLSREPFVILAGRNYVRPLRGLIELTEPLAGMGIGTRLAWLTHSPSEPT